MLAPLVFVVSTFCVVHLWTLLHLLLLAAVGSHLIAFGVEMSCIFLFMDDAHAPRITRILTGNFLHARVFWLFGMMIIMFAWFIPPQIAADPGFAAFLLDRYMMLRFVIAVFHIVLVLDRK